MTRLEHLREYLAETLDVVRQENEYATTLELARLLIVLVLDDTSATLSGLDDGTQP